MKLLQQNVLILAVVYVQGGGGQGAEPLPRRGERGGGEGEAEGRRTSPSGGSRDGARCSAETAQVLGGDGAGEMRLRRPGSGARRTRAAAKGRCAAVVGARS